MRSKIKNNPVKNPYQKFAEYKDVHKNETIIVCGCGYSLKTLEHPERTITIGVNDVGRQFTPDYLVVLNPKNQFKGDRFKYVETSKAKALFTQLNLKTKNTNTNTVKFKLGKRGGTTLNVSAGLPYTRNSPYVALCLAMYMGAKRIGVIGVDFTQNHFFSNTGKHALSASLKSINLEYLKLFKDAKKQGVEIINLSEESKVTAFPKESLAQFYLHAHSAMADNNTEYKDGLGLVSQLRLGETNMETKDVKETLGAGIEKEQTLYSNSETKALNRTTHNKPLRPSKLLKPRKLLKIVSYSTMPVAGVPEILSSCINRYTDNECRCVWATNSYGNGVSFQSDIEWKVKPKLAMQVLKDADLVIVHNGKVAAQHELILRMKPVITMAHNYIWNVDQAFVKRGFPGVVVAQYQATLSEFKDWSPVPNPMLLDVSGDSIESQGPGNWKGPGRPKGNSSTKNNEITICYTPSGKHDVYPKTHRLYWHSKGYAATMAILDKLASRFPIKLEVIRDKQLPHSEVLAMKARSHIVIDECVTGSYHRNSLEGLEHSCVVVNGMGILKGLDVIFEKCSGAASPFIGCTLNQLELVLVDLINRGREVLVEDGKKNRAWIENNWRFSDQWEKLWMPEVERAMHKKYGSEQKLSEKRLLERVDFDAESGNESFTYQRESELGQKYKCNDKERCNNQTDDKQNTKEKNVVTTRLKRNIVDVDHARKPDIDKTAPMPVAKSKRSIASQEQNPTSMLLGRSKSKPAKPKPKPKDIPVYWTCRQSRRGNFGDMLSPVLTKSLSGKEAVFRNSGSRLFAVGSLIKFANKGDVIWGTGFISASDKCKRGVDIKAVRGPLTRNIILKQGIDCPEIYGDPGLLLPTLYPQSNQKGKGIGVIPHYVDYERVRAQLSNKGIHVIDIRAGITHVIKAATQCEVLLCSSLHGCILGESYGIPTAWVELSDKVVGKGFKFRDYYASTDRDPKCIDWRKGIDIDHAVNVALDMTTPKIDLNPLVDAFPFPNECSSVIRSRLGSIFSPVFKNDLKVDYKQSCVQSRNQSVNKGNLAQQIEAEKYQNEPHRVGTVINDSNLVRDISTDSKKTDDCEPDFLANGSPTKIAVFGAITENYTEYMIASLRSFIKHNKESEAQYDAFILGHAFSSRTQRLISQFGIGYININLKKEFTRHVRHRYPGECFWIFKGPELFASRGYQYSLAVDGDTLCNKPLDISWLPQLTHIAGVNRGCGVGKFLENLNQLETLKRGFVLNDNTLKRPATNSGVLFFNNIELVKEKFFERMVKTYQRSERLGVLRGGDDSTLALFLASNPNIDLHILEDSWNLYRGIASQGNTPAIDALAKCAYVLHLSSLKPWQHHSHYPNRLMKDAIEQWRVLWPNSKNQRRWRSIERAKERLLAVAKINSDKSNKQNNNKAAVSSVKSLQKRSRGKPSATPSTTLSKQKTNERSALVNPNRNRLGLNLYWYRGRSLNVGDEITPYLLSKMLNKRLGISPSEIPSKPVRDPSKTSNLSLLSIGSIMRLSSSNTVVWGSGIRNIDQLVNKAAKFCAVRGPLTRRRLLQLGYSCPEVYGDPAVLLPKYYYPKVESRYKLGIIPHLVDYSEIKRQYGNEKDVLIIDLQTADVELIIQQILSCECTASSSLHGLILSVAYGISTKWIKCAGNIMGDDTKFYDYFSSLNPSLCEILNLANVSIVKSSEGQSHEFDPYRPLSVTAPYPDINQLIGSTWRHNQTIDLEKLEAAFPIRFFQRQVMAG